MNWGRGLFRLWLVASVLWMAASLLMMETFQSLGEYRGGEMLRTDVAASELSVSAMNDGVVTISFEGRALEVDTGGAQPEDTEVWARLLEAAAREVNDTADLDNLVLLVTREIARRDVIEGLVVAALPPLFVLMLGASLLWAVRGFYEGRRK